MSSSISRQKRHRDNADSPFRYRKKSMTNHPMLKMPDSHKDSELERQGTKAPQLTNSVRPSSRINPKAAKHTSTASATKQTSEPSSRRHRKAQYTYTEGGTGEEHGTEEHGDGEDQHGRRPVTAAEWRRVYQRHTQSETPFSDATLDMMYTMPRLLRELGNMKAAVSDLDGGSRADADHDAALEVLHVGELLCEHMQSEWTAAQRPAA